MANSRRSERSGRKGSLRTSRSRNHDLEARIAALEAENAKLKTKDSGRDSPSSYDAYDAQDLPPSLQTIYNHHDEKHEGDVEKGCFSLMCGQEGSTARTDNKRKLVRRVYGALTIQLLLTFIIVAGLASSASSVTWVLRNYNALWWSTFIGSIVSLLVLFCGFSRKYPVNIILFVVFTVCIAGTISLSTSILVCRAVDSATNTCVISGEAQRTILQAFAITMIIFLTLTVFEFQTRIDFSFLGGILSVVLCVLLWWGIFGGIFGFGGSGMAYAIIGIILFFFYILYDTYLIVERYEDPEMWVEASIQIYLDVINLFLFILACLTGTKND
jgi:FtsH-binding integral membrane protein